MTIPPQAPGPFQPFDQPGPGPSSQPPDQSQSPWGRPAQPYSGPAAPSAGGPSGPIQPPAAPQPGASPPGPSRTSGLAGAGQTFKKALDQATDKVGQAGPNRELIHLIPLGAGLLALLSSFLPYYTVSVSFLGFNQTMTASAWGGGSGWVGALLTLVGGVAVSVRTLFGKSISLTQAAVAQARAIGLVALVLAWLLVLISMFGWAGSGLDAYSDFVSTGRGIGFWLTWLFTTVAVVTAALIWRSSRAQGAVPAAGSSAPVALPPSGQTSPAGPGPVAPGQAGPGQTGPWSDPTTQAAPPWSPPPAGPPQPPASPTSWPSQPAGPPTAGPPQPPGPPIG